MGRSALEKLRADALKLPEPERAELAQDLVASLDGPADKHADQLWDAEILRRLAEIDAGIAKLIDRDEFTRRLRAALKRA